MSARTRPVIWTAAFFAIFIVAVGVLWWNRRGTAAPSGASLPDRKSIAVLPFQNLSPEPENAFFADGMTEDILTQLAKIRDLKVISRSSVMRYKGSQKPIQTIATELGVATVLEGSVRRSGNRVRIVGQLIDARTDEHLWAEAYDRELKDVFTIQGEVAQQIAGALRARLSPLEKKRLGQQPTQNLTAYDHYLKGRDLYYRYRKADNDASVEFFQKALALDSDFALAYAGLGDSYAQRALRFGYPRSWFLGRFDEALPRHQQAIAQDPTNPIFITGLAVLYDALGEEQQAEGWLKRALELHPELGQSHDYMMMFYLRHHRDTDALRQAKSALALLPNDAYALHGAARTRLVTGDLEGAEPLLQHLAEMTGGTRGFRDSGAGVETQIAYLRLRAGKRSEAEALLEQSLSVDRRAAETGNEDASVPYDTACVRALQGEKDDAFRSLDRAVEAGWRGWPLGARDPLLDSLRGDLRFKALESRLANLVTQMRRRVGLSLEVGWHLVV